MWPKKTPAADLARKRLLICTGSGRQRTPPCPYLGPGRRPRCTACGCFVTAKVKIPSEKCPKDRW